MTATLERPVRRPDHRTFPSAHATPSWRGRMLRLAAVIVGLAAWFTSQALIGRIPPPTGVIGDGVHRATGSANRYLLAHPRVADGLLIASSLGIDSLGIFLLAASVFGRSIKPFLGLLILFALRQACQALCTLPPPQGIIWRNPGFPSLLVTYGVANDLFFSGHTALAVFGCLTLAQVRGRHRAVLVTVGVLVATFEIVVVLVLRAHYTMDVFAGAVAAFAVAGAADRLAPTVDRWLVRLARGKHHN
jgi:hypothetical protein